MARDIDEQLTKYLTDAHSIEVQALAQLRTAPAISGAPELAQAFRSHLEETEGHERLTRELLERRHAEPSKVKDVVMGVGGKGFLLFARLQPETLEAHVDVAVRATLDAHPRDELPTLVLKYLADAHAIEEQAIGLLERAPKLVQDSELEAVFDDHFSETRERAEVVQSRPDGAGRRLVVVEGRGDAAWRAELGLVLPGTPRYAGKARRVCVCLRAPRDRRLRAAEARGGRHRRRRDRAYRRDHPRRGAQRSKIARTHVRHGRCEVAARFIARSRHVPGVKTSECRRKSPLPISES
jgi:ferritin-like metal-binding protein YciE